MAWLFNNPKFQALDGNGDPLASGKLDSYDAGTSTRRALYPTKADALAQTNALANPVVLDSRGEATIYGKGAYKFVLKDSSDVTIWTEDNVELKYTGGQATRYLSEFLPSTGGANNDSAFKNAIDAIDATETELVVDVDDTLETSTGSGTITVPATLSLRFVKGATLTTTGYTLAVNGPVIAGIYEIFSRTGTVNLGDQYIREVYPQWFGAVVDGATDDKAAIQRAIDSLPSTGGMVFFTDGVYAIASGLTSASNIEFKGKGVSSHIKATASVDMLSIAGTLSATTSALASNATINADNIVLSSATGFSADDYILIDGEPGAGGSSTAEENKELNQIASIASDTLTLNNDIYDTYLTADTADATVVTLKQNIVIDGLKFENADNNKEWIDIQYGRNITIENCTFTVGQRLYAHESDRIYIHDSNFFSAGAGVRFDFVKYGGVKGNRFLDLTNQAVLFYFHSDSCVAENNYAQDISRCVEVNIFSENCIVDNNIGIQCSSYGFLLDADSHRVRFTNNEIANAANTAMALTDSDNIVATNNVIRNCLVTSMTLEGCSHAKIAGNQLYTNGSTTSHHGIHVFTTAGNNADRNLIIGNVVDTVTGESIVLDGSAGASCEGNIVTGNTIDTGYRGIIVTTATHPKINNNSFDGAGGQNARLIGGASLLTVEGDRIFQTQKIDFNGAAIADQIIFRPPCNGVIYRLSIYFDTATHATNSPKIDIGIIADADEYATFAQDSATLINQTAGTVNDFHIGESGEAILTSGLTTTDTLVVLDKAAARGTGTITIELAWISFGEA